MYIHDIRLTARGMPNQKSKTSQESRETRLCGVETLSQPFCDRAKAWSLPLL